VRRPGSMPQVVVKSRHCSACGAAWALLPVLRFADETNLHSKKLPRAAAHLAGGLLQGVPRGGVVQLDGQDAAVVVQVPRRLGRRSAHLGALRLAAQRLRLRGR
jgi:hypothetical protein